jgi:hypothetical protein
MVSSFLRLVVNAMGFCRQLLKNQSFTNNQMKKNELMWNIVYYFRNLYFNYRKINNVHV